MIDEFKSIQELYNRVLPALKIRVNEAKRNGLNIKESDIWKYLISIKWKNGSNLMLFDIVDDILNAELTEINEYKIKEEKNEK